MSDLTKIALMGLDESVRSFVESDTALAKVACERERELDELYVQRLQQIAVLIDSGEAKGNPTLHLLAVLKYLEKVLDFVQNIGEITFYSLTGTRLTYPQFKQLDALLPDGAKPGAGTSFRHFWDGISGATVIEISRPEGRLLFKEGSRPKLQPEFDKAIEWEGIAPEHTARVIAISHDRGRVGILREFAEGALLLDLLLSEDPPESKIATMRNVTDVLVDVWTTTITPRTPRLDYTGQIRTRLREVLRRHPSLEKVARERLEGLGGLYDLLTHLESREAALAPPFSIWMHGDLNANNVVIDESSKSVIFIDVHRSRYGDYLQDLAVLVTSPMRKFPRGKIAKGVVAANEVLLESAQEFARQNGDIHFKERLRLARARALVTSARLDADPERAESLFLEGLDLLKKVAKGMRVAAVRSV